MVEGGGLGAIEGGGLGVIEGGGLGVIEGGGLGAIEGGGLGAIEGGGLGATEGGGELKAIMGVGLGEVGVEGHVVWNPSKHEYLTPHCRGTEGQ